MESSTAQNMDRIENRTGIERRSGKDRRCDYDEQRKILRSKLKPGVFIFLNQPRLFKRLQLKKRKFAEILDISLTGLRAQYVASGLFKYEQPMLSIVTNDGAVKIDNISFKTVTDNKVTNLPNNTQLRRCSIKFEEISDNQKLQLNQIIRKFSDK